MIVAPHVRNRVRALADCFVGARYALYRTSSTLAPSSDSVAGSCDPLRFSNFHPAVQHSDEPRYSFGPFAQRALTGSGLLLRKPARQMVCRVLGGQGDSGCDAGM